MPDDVLLAIADELYALPLGEFTAERDRLAREHRKGDRALSEAVKGLRKASLSAWVVNLLVRRDPDQVDQVLTVGEALREAQSSLDAAQLRELTRQRRQLTAAVTTSARRLARAEGVRVTEQVAEQVEATLTAAMLDAEAARAVRSGLLVAAVSATGLGDLDLSANVALPGALGFVATPRVVGPPDPDEPPRLHVVPDPDAAAKARAAADAAVAALEKELAEAARARQEASASVDDLQARTLQLQSELDELRHRMVRLEADLEDVDAELEEAEALRDEAVESCSEVESRLDEARRHRDELA